MNSRARRRRLDEARAYARHRGLREVDVAAFVKAYAALLVPGDPDPPGIRETFDRWRGTPPPEEGQ